MAKDHGVCEEMEEESGKVNEFRLQRILSTTLVLRLILPDNEFVCSQIKSVAQKHVMPTRIKPCN